MSSPAATPFYRFVTVLTAQVAGRETHANARWVGSLAGGALFEVLPSHHRHRVASAVFTGEEMLNGHFVPRLRQNDPLVNSAWSYCHHKDAMRSHGACGVAHIYRHLDLGWLARLYQ
jgi:hypothetical protein